MICMNATCSKKGRWTLLRQDIKFADWQRVRMQETSKEIHVRSLPRSLDAILFHDIVEQARADFVMGDTAAIISKSTGAPLDRVKLLLQNQGELLKREREGSVTASKGSLKKKVFLPFGWLRPEGADEQVDGGGGEMCRRAGRWWWSRTPTSRSMVVEGAGGGGSAVKNPRNRGEDGGWLPRRAWKSLEGVEPCLQQEEIKKRFRRPF
ncbi:hypothetical protein E3N88_05891 [Mikania micrantha]|uniref:MCM OB domain-containing protein n=1 Tax=Mikania micrantha TaxID=192012 RepID=A0A5N6PP24_9ASTR|nr:hypothetical protein E3N88_05891 [Mikania micrantha]